MEPGLAHHFFLQLLDGMVSITHIPAYMGEEMLVGLMELHSFRDLHKTQILNLQQKSRPFDKFYMG